MDLKDLDPARSQGFLLTLVHPVSGAALPAKLTVLGADSEEYRDTLRAQMRKRAEKMARGGNRRLAVNPDELEDDAIELLAAVTVAADWGGMTLDGQAPKDLRQVYKRFVWIREQVDQAVTDRANFLPGSATS